MADTIKSSNELKLEAGFYDNDTRTIAIENPKATLAKADIKALETLTVNTQPIIGDKGSAAFVKFNSAKILEKTTTQLDLS